jgi:hypothetical protein
MQFVVTKQKDGTFRTYMTLPGSGGDLQAVAKGITAADATVKAARSISAKADAKKAPDKSKKKAALALAIAKTAANPAVRAALKTGGLEAAKLAASAVPGGAIMIKALGIASKMPAARRLFKALIR